MFKFSIKIDDSAHSLNKENGISIEKIGELLQTLHKAIANKSNIKCTLGEIRGNCYALDFFTEEKTYVEKFVVVHKNIESIPINLLEKGQQEYANTLKKVLGGKYYLKAYDENNSEIASIRDLNIEKEVDLYFTQKTVYGIVSELGGASLDSPNKHIKIDGVPYSIKISKNQDIELKTYYGTDKLRIKVRERRTVKNSRVVDAELISFEVVGKGNLIENLESEKYINFALIKDTHTIEELVDRIYGYPK